jgi:hypothetical protein
MDIQALRAMRKNDFGSISNAFEKIANPSTESKGYADDRFWKLEGDKAGNGTATIRFLPKTDADELPWAKIFSHGFQGPTGKWYIENSLTTLGEQDPVSELNSQLWNSGVEANKKIAQTQKRRLSYIANVLVVSDPKHPENEGKVFLFKFGKKIFDKIMDKARPTFEDETPVNVFDLWEGADFKLRMRKVDGYPNYDQSAFLEPNAISEDENKLLTIVNSQHKLGEFLDRKNFKTYEELSRKLAMVLDSGGTSTPSAASIAEEDTEVRQVKATKPKVSIPSADDDDEAMSFFKKIAMEE